MNTPLRIDLHCHTTESDGKLTTSELVQEAVRKNLELVAVTDHDRVNHEAVAWLRSHGILSPFAVEISAKDYKRDISLHILYYAKSISAQTESILENIRTSRMKKIEWQCLLLAKNGFDITYETLCAFAKSRWIAADCINNGTIGIYISQQPRFLAYAEFLINRPILGMQEVIDAFLKETSEYPEVGYVKIPDYEPSIELLTKIAKEEGGLLSIAHPNFTFMRRGGVTVFEEAAREYLASGVGGIEYNALATQEYEEVTRRVAKETGAILTFGSDFHGDENGRHCSLWDIHPTAEASKRMPREEDQFLAKHSAMFVQRVFI